MQDISRISDGEYKASTRFCVFSYTRDQSGNERPLCCGSTNNTKFEVRADLSIHAFCYQCRTGGVIITSPLDTSRFKPVPPLLPLISPSTMRHARDVTIVDYSDVANCCFDQHCASPYLKELSAGTKLYERNTLKTIAIKSSMGTGKTVAAREAINRFEMEFREAKLAEYNVRYTPQLVKDQCQITPTETAVPPHAPARLFKEGGKAWQHNMRPLLFKHTSLEKCLSEDGGYLLECNSAHGVPMEITYFPNTCSFYETVTYETPSFTCRSTGLPAHGPFTSSLQGRTLETVEEMSGAIRARSLVVSFRAMLAQANTTQLNTVCYSTLSDGEMSQENRVSVQLDSLPRLVTQTLPLEEDGLVVIKKAPRYDLVFVDESESCINHLSSNTMKDRRNLVFSLFKGFIKAANVVIFADADMGERTRFLIDNFRSDAPVEFHHNPYNPRELTYIEYASLHVWVNKMVELIVKGKKIYFFSNLRDTLHAVSKVVRRRVYEIGEKTNKEWLMAIGSGEGVKVLDSKMDNNEKVRMARDCNAEWSQYTLFCVTPVIGAGVSFDAEHFDASFGFGSNTSNSPREFLQMGGRVRNLKTGECHLYLDVRKGGNTIAKTQEEYIEKLAECRMKTQHIIVGSSETDVLLEYKLPYAETYTRALNWIEKDMSRVDFRGQLHKVLYANNPDVVIRFNHDLNDLLEYKTKMEMNDKKAKVKGLVPRQIADSSYHGDQMEHINREDRAGRQPLSANGEGVTGIHFSHEKHEVIKALCLKHPVGLSVLERRKYEEMLSETISGIKVEHLEAIHSLLVMDTPFPSEENTVYQAQIVNRNGGVVYKSRKNLVRDRLGDLDPSLVRTALETLVIASGAMQVGTSGRMEPVAKYWPRHSRLVNLLEFELHTGLSWFINDMDPENRPSRVNGSDLLVGDFNRAAFRTHLEDVWPLVRELVGPHVNIGDLGSAPKKDKLICSQVRFALKKILVNCFGVKLKQDVTSEGIQARCGLRMANDYYQLCPHMPKKPCTVFRVQGPEMKRLLPYLLGYTQYRVDDGEENKNTTSAAKTYNRAVLQTVKDLHTRYDAGLLPLQETSRFTGLAGLQVVAPTLPKNISFAAKRVATKAQALGDFIRAEWEKIKEENVPLPLSDTPALALVNYLTSPANKMRTERLVNEAVNHFQLGMVRARKELDVEDVSTRRFDAQQRSAEKKKSDIETSIQLNIQEKNSTPPAPSMLHPRFVLSEALESDDAGELTAPSSPIDLYDMDQVVDLTASSMDLHDHVKETKRPRSNSDLFAIDSDVPTAKRARDPKSIATILPLDPSSRPGGAEPYHGMYYTVERSTSGSPWQVSKKCN